MNDKHMYELNVSMYDDFKKLLYNINPQIIISCLRGNFNDQLMIHKIAAQYLKNIVNGIINWINTIINKKMSGVYHVGSNKVIEYKKFIEELIDKLDIKPTKLIEEKFSEKTYMAVLPKEKYRYDWLSITNKEIIDEITENILVLKDRVVKLINTDGKMKDS